MPRDVKQVEQLQDIQVQSLLDLQLNHDKVYDHLHYQFQGISSTSLSLKMKAKLCHNIVEYLFRLDLLSEKAHVMVHRIQAMFTDFIRKHPDLLQSSDLIAFYFVMAIYFFVHQTHLSNEISLRNNFSSIPIAFLLSILERSNQPCLIAHSSQSACKSGFHKRRRLKHSSSPSNHSKEEEEDQLLPDDLGVLFRTRWPQILALIATSESLSSVLRSFSSLVLTRLLHVVVQQSANAVLLCKTDALMRATPLRPGDLLVPLASLRSFQDMLFTSSWMNSVVSGLVIAASPAQSNFMLFIALGVVDGVSTDNDIIKVYLNSLSSPFHSFRLFFCDEGYLKAYAIS